MGTKDPQMGSMIVHVKLFLQAQLTMISKFEYNFVLLKKKGHFTFSLLQFYLFQKASLAAILLPPHCSFLPLLQVSVLHNMTAMA